MRALGTLWALPNTVLALVLWLLSSLGSNVNRRAGALLVVVPRGLLAWFFRRSGMAGLTLGSVVFLADAEHAADPRFLAHELAHVRQQWVFGPLFVPLYLLASVVPGITGRGWHRGNPFEVAAREAARKP